ncbi:MAG: response regulator [candidate division NC10 bacterium]|nr:response regulator [candidate division NC10 bacterium]
MSREDVKIVLVVDDDPMMIEMVKDFLESHDYHVISASSGQEALAKADISKPDVLILDVMMRGMDGYETCRHLKQGACLSGVPVIMFTAGTDPKFQQRAFAAGADFCLSKPFDLDRFLNVVSMAAAKKVKPSATS